MAPVRCPLCGTAHATCGQRTTGVGVTFSKGTPMVNDPILRPYAVTIGGVATTLMLTEREATARGLLPEKVDVPPAAAPAVKLRVPTNKARADIPDK